jgi:hypothetical protein
MEGDIRVSNFSVGKSDLGSFASHFLWQGTELQFSSTSLKFAEGLIRGRGTMALSSYLPRYKFTANVSGFRWRGGLLSADGAFETSGLGTDALQNLRATGVFSGQDLALSNEDMFNRIGGAFEFSFSDGSPNLKLSNVQASESDEAWSGNAATQSDGRIVIDLEHAGRQRQIISTLDAESPAAVSAIHASPAER